MTNVDQPSLLDPPAKTPPKKLDTLHAREMLRKRFPPPEWSLMEEVAPSTGGGTRYADAIAVNLWKSRGHAIHGFEIKVSRADWLRELKAPEKAEPLYRFCNHWWVVAPRGVVQDGELPSNWGLYELRESGLSVGVQAPRLTPEPITIGFFASLMRRGHEQIHEIAAIMQRAAVEAAYGDIDKRVQREVTDRTRELTRLREHIATFEQQTGLTFSQYAGPPVRTVRLAMSLEPYCKWDDPSPFSRLLGVAEELEHAAVAVRDALARVEPKSED